MPASRALRIFALIILLGLIVAVTAYLMTHPDARRFLKEPHKLGADARRWVAHHALFAPAILVLVYAACAVLMLPVWWIQILAGYGFGLAFGVVWCSIGQTIGATCAAAISRFIAAEWFHRRVEAKMHKLRRLEETLEHNGLLVVMAVRLVHVLPYGLSNYAIGLTTISIPDVLVGNLLGGLPVTLLGVTVGADPELLKHWEFDVILVGVNITLLLPLALRYLKPQWFRRIGIE
jgi:uncharacterized membrane protein YdjX (TVP38/TMEM64 family)